MNDTSTSQRSGQAGSGATAPAAAPSLPDINAETFPFEQVQRLLDRAAHFNWLSTPEGDADARIRDRGETIGVRVRESLHPFAVATDRLDGEAGLRVSNAAGPAAGSFEHRWLFAPPDHFARPGQEPPRAAFDPSRSQRFAMLDGVCHLTATDGFHGFGTGRTLPVRVAGRTELQVAAVGTLLRGFGALAGRHGTYTYCGTLQPERGFVGNLLVRVVDPTGDLLSAGEPPGFAAIDFPDPAHTYLLLRGQKRGRDQKTEYSFGPDGGVDGLNVEQQLRLFSVGHAAGRAGLKATARIGPVAGRMTARIRFNFLSPGAPGTDLSPIPFQSYNTYVFTDRRNRTLGTIEADGGEGRTFTLAFDDAPGQRALRFGGFGPIVKGTGIFHGISGMMTDNSVVGIAPHVLATQYVLRILDPEGRFRTLRY